MPNIGNRIKLRRKELGLTLQQLGDKIGVEASTVRKWENNIIQNIKTDKISKIASALGVTINYIIDDSRSDQSNKAIKIPILGTVIAGIPISAIEEIIGWEEISPKLASQGEYFALKIKGDSMSPTMDENDIVIVKKQNNISSGDIAIVCINGDEATCKKIIKHKDGISLVSLNSKYEPMYYDKNDIADKPIHIIGKVVELRRRF